MAIVFASMLTKLEKQKVDLLFEIEHWAPESLSQRPAPSEWSVLEMLDHIVRTEIEILAAARHGPAKPHRIGISDKLRTEFIQKIFSSDRKVKVPASASHVLPASDLQLSEILERWNGSRSELQCFISCGDPKLLCQGIFKHPVGGWMGMPQILDFFWVHLVHHHYQLERIAQSLASITTSAGPNK